MTPPAFGPASPSASPWTCVGGAKCQRGPGGGDASPQSGSMSRPLCLWSNPLAASALACGLAVVTMVQWCVCHAEREMRRRRGVVTDQCTDTDTLHDGAPGAPLMVALMSRRRFLSFLFCAMSCSIVLCCSFVSFSSCALRRQMCVCVCV